jgi:cold-inducible RNA-binding protein
MFSKYGKLVSASVAKDRSTGRTKGFGFVVFEDSQDAKDAINALHDTEVDGSKHVTN